METLSASYPHKLAVPAVELHRHLEGSIRLSTLTEIALASSTKHDIPKGQEDRYWRSIFHIEEPCTDLTQMLDRFWAVQACISSESIIERITYEMIEDCYNEGTRVLEIRYSPQYMYGTIVIALMKHSQHNHPDLSFEAIHRGVLSGVRKATAKYDIAIGLLAIIDRNLPQQEASVVADFIMQHKSDFVGMDLANDELQFPSKPFASYFQDGKRAGLKVTVHAGESLTSNVFAANVKEAIDVLGAERIGHGVGIITDPAILEYVKQKGVVLEVCPTSNYLVGLVPTRKAHPIRQLLDKGVKISVSTDDPGLFNISLPTEFDVLRNEFNFSTEELIRCNQIGLEASFIPAQDKNKFFTPKPDVSFNNSYLLTTEIF